MADCARAMLGSLAGGFRWPHQLLFSNMWLFGPLIKAIHPAIRRDRRRDHSRDRRRSPQAILASKPQSSTLVRTTTALTVTRAGDKSNALPSRATAVVNCRLHPRDSVGSALDRIRRVVTDERVQIDLLEARALKHNQKVPAGPPAPTNT